MAPQTSIPVAANVLGTIGTVFWCIQLVPQIWYNWKQKKTDGLPGLMMFIWATSAVPGWPVWKASLLASAIGALFGGLQVLLVLTLRVHAPTCPFSVTHHTNFDIKGPYLRGVEWPMTLVGVLSAILLAGGLIPPYFEIAKRNGRVVGIMAQNSFDVLGGVQYIICLLLEIGIFASHLIFLLRTRSLRRRAKETRTPFDAMPEARRFVFPRPVAVEGNVAAVEGEGDVEKAGNADVDA
ncbi:MAG: hypothetical protein Q9185_006833, partial [Variospora sp. 1 TL-2023]